QGVAPPSDNLVQLPAKAAAMGRRCTRLRARHHRRTVALTNACVSLPPSGEKQRSGGEWVTLLDDIGTAPDRVLAREQDEPADGEAQRFETAGFGDEAGQFLGA